MTWRGKEHLPFGEAALSALKKIVKSKSRDSKKRQKLIKSAFALLA
jgi:hypothetical protein